MIRHLPALVVIAAGFGLLVVAASTVFVSWPWLVPPALGMFAVGVLAVSLGLGRILEDAEWWDDSEF